MSLIDEKIEQINYVDKFILLLLGAKNSESIPGPIHLQKEMYMLQNIFPELADETDYEPYLLGPYSEIVANEAEQLKSSGLIRKESDGFKLTPDGTRAFNVLKQHYSSDKEIQSIERFKEFLNDLTKDELLVFVYFSYPSPDALEKESIEYKGLLKKRKRLAMSMYQKGKVSAQKAAQLAGVFLEDFLQELKDTYK